MQANYDSQGVVRGNGDFIGRCKVRMVFLCSLVRLLQGGPGRSSGFRAVLRVPGRSRRAQGGPLM